MTKEEDFLKIISKTVSNSSFIGDDCAYLKDLEIVISQDTLVQNVHFSLDFISPKELAKKALLVNLSDILASGGKPEYLTISISGNVDEEFIEDFYKGADEICKKFNVCIIGGDLTGGREITVSISIIGTTKGRNISSRKNAKAGQIVLLQGVHGSSAKGLEILIKKGRSVSNEEEKFVKAHLEPELYPKISEFAALNFKNPYVMTDTSDGLYDAFKKIQEASSVGFKIELEKVQKETDEFDKIMFGGEDYGLFICIDVEDYEKIKHLNIPKIGVVTDKKEILIDGKKIDKDLRFEHF